MIAFRERNPAVIGAVGLATIVGLMVGAFNLGVIPGIGPDRTFVAAFSDASGLSSGAPVQVAGTEVGKVADIELAGDHVEITFKVEDGVHFGTKSAAAIRVFTVLGSKYLQLKPRGPGQLDEGTMIPLARTTPAYDIVNALGDLTRTTERIDTKKLSTALDTLSKTFDDTPEEVRKSFEGLSRLSRTIASRDRQLQQLLSHANSVSSVLDERNEEFSKLVRDGNRILTEIRKRRKVIHQLLVSTSLLSSQLTKLVQENEEQIQPALQRLHEVLSMLRQNQASLERSIKALAPFARVLGNIVGNGPWFDAYVVNLFGFGGGFVPGPRPSQGGDKKQ